MPFAADCPHCKKRIPVEVGPVAYSATCPHCSGVFGVPAVAGPGATTPLPVPLPAPPAESPRRARRTRRAASATPEASPRARLWIAAGVAALAVVVAVLAAMGTRTKDSPGGDPGGDPPGGAKADEPPPPDGGQDLEAYTQKLMRDTPVASDTFEKKGLRAVEYERNARYPVVFKSATLAVDRVYLTDRVSGRGGWYTRARLFANDPSARPGAPEPFRWVRVEMLP